MRSIFLLIFGLSIGTLIFGQKQVSFFSADSLRITADLYLKNEKLPFVVLFHQGQSSRGEFREIANRLLKLDVNCLAVDLRTGGKMQFIDNETARRAKAGKYDQSYLAAKKDIVASLQFVKKYSTEPVILFGSSFSASLCLVEAAERTDVAAVIAFSPGEYFRPALIVKDEIRDLKIPLFIAATRMESEYVEEMLTGIEQEYITLYVPSSKEGVHGAKALWSDSEGSEEIWLQLLVFFKGLRGS